MNRLILAIALLINFYCVAFPADIAEQCKRLEAGEVIGGENMSTLRSVISNLITLTPEDNNFLCVAVTANTAGTYEFPALIGYLADKYKVSVSDFYKFHFNHLRCGGELAIIMAMKLNGLVFDTIIMNGFPVNGTISVKGNDEETLILQYLEDNKLNFTKAEYRGYGRLLRKDYKAKLCREVEEGTCS